MQPRPAAFSSQARAQKSIEHSSPHTVAGGVADLRSSDRGPVPQPWCRAARPVAVHCVLLPQHAATARAATAAVRRQSWVRV